MRHSVATAGVALTALLCGAGVAGAQVDLRYASGSSIHVGGHGDVQIRSGNDRIVSRAHHGRGASRGSCPGGRLDVSGTGARLNVAGPCTHVAVSGTGNTIRVRLAPGAVAELSGTRNVLIWTTADPHGPPPRVENSGTGNAARPG